MSLAARIAAAGDALEVAVSGGTADALVRFVELIVHWNRRIRVVGPSDALTIVDEHVVDALGFARVVARAGAPAWYDIGAGAGLPGLVLACLYPELRFSLVEPVAKKTAFIHHAATVLGLRNVTVLNTRLEQLPQGGPTAAMSRATFPPEVWFARAAALVGPGGLVLVALGHADAPALAATAELRDDYELPGSGAHRSNLLLRIPALAPGAEAR